MLGRLARWLRLLGYDTAYDNEATDAELAQRARAEGRVLLTRDRELAARRGLSTLLIESETLKQQVREVFGAVPRPNDATGARCAVCNHVLEPAGRDEVRLLVPPYVLRTHSHFYRCLGCGRVYWRGTHFQAIRSQIDAFSLGDPRDE